MNETPSDYLLAEFDRVADAEKNAEKNRKSYADAIRRQFSRNFGGTR